MYCVTENVFIIYDLSAQRKPYNTKMSNFGDPKVHYQGTIRPRPYKKGLIQ